MRRFQPSRHNPSFIELQQAGLASLQQQAAESTSTPIYGDERARLVEAMTAKEWQQCQTALNAGGVPDIATVQKILRAVRARLEAAARSSGRPMYQVHVTPSGTTFKPSYSIGGGKVPSSSSPMPAVSEEELIDLQSGQVPEELILLDGRTDQASEEEEAAESNLGFYLIVGTVAAVVVGGLYYWRSRS